MRLSRLLAVLALATSLYLMVTDDQKPPPNPAAIQLPEEP